MLRSCLDCAGLSGRVREKIVCGVDRVRLGSLVLIESDAVLKLYRRSIPPPLI